jgi:hypothetical protein
MKAKFVYENIRFERGGDPLTSMGIGPLPNRVVKEIESLIKGFFPNSEIFVSEVKEKKEYYKIYYFLKITMDIFVPYKGRRERREIQGKEGVQGEIDEALMKNNLELWDWSWVFSNSRKNKTGIHRKDRGILLHIEILSKDAADISLGGPPDEW